MKKKSRPTAKATNRRAKACEAAVDAVARLVGWARAVNIDPRVKMPASVRKMLRDRVCAYQVAIVAIRDAEQDTK